MAPSPAPVTAQAPARPQRRADIVLRCRLGGCRRARRVPAARAGQRCERCTASTGASCTRSRSGRSAGTTSPRTQPSRRSCAPGRPPTASTSTATRRPGWRRSPSASRSTSTAARPAGPTSALDDVAPERRGVGQPPARARHARRRVARAARDRRAPGRGSCDRSHATSRRHDPQRDLREARHPVGNREVEIAPRPPKARHPARSSEGVGRMNGRPTNEEREALIAGDRAGSLEPDEAADLALLAGLLGDPSTWAEPRRRAGGRGRAGGRRADAVAPADASPASSAVVTPPRPLAPASTHRAAGGVGGRGDRDRPRSRDRRPEIEHERRLHGPAAARPRPRPRARASADDHPQQGRLPRRARRARASRRCRRASTTRRG